MPTITINGILPETDPKKQEEFQSMLEALMREMVEVAREISTINYDERDVMVWFPRDLMAKGLGEEFSIDIACLDRPPNLMLEDYIYENYIAAKFALVVARFFPEYCRIESDLRPFSSHKGGYAVARGPEQIPEEGVAELQG
ncbi:MAG: hypothetical protein HYS15_02795 [Candidatus Spechtbacteria bacterium]|nr:hypothetical protein [Candidatus Spechtbacteria bacterium]